MPSADVQRVPESAMERPIFKPIGTAAEDLDPCSLVVDRRILEQNIETMHSFFRDREVKLRPHVDGHRSPTIAHMQIAAGGTVGGVSVTTLGQAEVFVEYGFSDIFVTNVVVTDRPIARLCALARRAKMTIAADSPAAVHDLSEAATASEVVLNVVVDVNTRLGRCGVEPGEPAVDLAREIAAAEGLTFSGLMTYEGTILEDDKEAAAAESRRWIQQVLDTREAIELTGLDVVTVSVGGTHNYEIAAEMPGVTEVPAGSYALMDQRYGPHRPQFEPAARILAVIVSTPEPGVAIMDAGQKAIGTDTGLPRIENIPGATVRPMSAEHGSLTLEDGDVSVGDRVWVLPWDIGSTVNLHDYMQVVRDGRLEAVWDIPARGRYR